MPLKRLVLKILLLEDAHFGTGLGRGAVDATTTRDRDGAPVIWWTHLKGVLRANAVELERRGGLDPGSAVLLFGWDSQSDGEQAVGRAHVSSAFVDSAATAPPKGWFHLVTSSARLVESRQPRDDTMRTTELVRAGCTLSARCEVLEEDSELFQKVLNATSRLGADRSRGALVRITVEEEVPANRNLITNANEHDLARRLRLRLRAIDPLCFGMEPTAGNIVDSQHFIPGSALSGALIRAVAKDRADTDPWIAGALIDRTISIGNAYPLPYPCAHDADLSQISVMPAPLNYQQPKSTAASLNIPDWAQTTTARPSFLDTTARDLLASDSGDIASKRLNDDAYVVRQSLNHPWQLYRAPLSARMRIGVPSDGWATARDATASQQFLYATEEIPERSEFVAEIRFLEADTEKRKKVIGQVTRQLLKSGGFLRLGRGARQVEVVEAVWLPDPVSPESGDISTSDVPETLALVLESDLILRGPNLGFVTSLNLAALQWMIQAANGQWPASSHSGSPAVEVTTIGDTIRVAGFNASSGLPRAGQIAIRRGTHIRISGPKDVLTNLEQVFSAQRSWGERQHEGYGRIVVWGRKRVGGDTTNTQGSVDKTVGASDEALCAQAKSMVTEQSDSLAKLFCKLRKSAIYDFVSLSKRSLDPSWPDELKRITGHYAERTGSTTELAAAWTNTAPNPRLLYYLARWTVALGKFVSENGDAAEDDKSAKEIRGER